MFVFGVKKAQVWLSMAVLLLCSSVTPHSGHPLAEENEDLPDAEESLDTEDYKQNVRYEDEDFEEGLEEAAGVEHDRTDCAEDFKDCNKLDCCDKSKTCVQSRQRPNVKICLDKSEGAIF